MFSVLTHRLKYELIRRPAAAPADVVFLLAAPVVAGAFLFLLLLRFFAPPFLFATLPPRTPPPAAFPLPLALLFASSLEALQAALPVFLSPSRVV